MLFCGINPSLYSAATGHHFARPGNRFWPALYLGGFTSRLLAPWEERRLLEDGYGITNLVSRATAGAAELAVSEMVAGRKQLEGKLRRHRPQWLALLGVGAYRSGFHRPRATVGFQPETFAGATVWVLPNPSGLNAHHQLPDLGRAFAELRAAVGDVRADVARRGTRA